MDQGRHPTTLNITGDLLKKAITTQLRVVFQLYCGTFQVKDGKSRIAAQFVEGGFDRPVEFELIAPPTTQDTTLTLEMQVQGLSAARLTLDLQIVEDIKTANAHNPDFKPETLDLGYLIEELLKKEAPRATLMIDLIETHRATLDVDEDPQIECDSPALTQEAIAKISGEMAEIMSAIAEQSVWLELTDPLNPNDEEYQQHAATLANMMAKAARAGYIFYDWLVHSAGLSDIVNKINALTVGSLIKVDTDNLSIPWEMVYPVPFFEDTQASKVDNAQFWGHRFVFMNMLKPSSKKGQSAATGRPAPLRRHRLAPKKLTALLNTDIDDENNWKSGKPANYQKGQFDALFTSGGVEFIDNCKTARALFRTQKNCSPFIYLFGHGRDAKLFALKEDCVINNTDADTNHLISKEKT